MQDTSLLVSASETTGQIASVQLYGQELLDQANPCTSELWVNGLPLNLRPHTDPNQPGLRAQLKGERFIEHFSGWSLVLSRKLGGRTNAKHPSFGIQSYIRRELCDQTFINPGPGGPVVEAPLWVDTFSIMNWNWQFWGEDTRMIFPSSHSQGPSDEHGHIGFEHDTPEQVKAFLQNTWRRIYPGVMVIHGGLFYNAKTENWLALTCRRPGVGYIVGIENAGRGVGYDFTLHSHFNIGEALRLPEVKLYYGPDAESMWSWLADYSTFFYQEPPEWVRRTTWRHGLAWDNQPSWTEQGKKWEQEVDEGLYSGISYSLVTNRPLHGGTEPYGYEPDPNHGSKEEFRAMGQSLKAKGIPWLVWMSHSGIAYQGGPEVDDDWFIRGIDGRICASWGDIDAPALAHINPGHPGYIEYTKKWIRFYMQECGATGIFFDCLGWAFPPDFKPRDFMRYPGDTNRMAIKFMEEAYACIKECNPDGLMLGEGTTLDAPISIFSVAGNPVRPGNTWGPRDFFLQLNRYAAKNGGKQFIIDQGGDYLPASGYGTVSPKAKDAERNRFFTTFLRERGGRDVWTHLPGDVSILDELLFVARAGHAPPHTEKPASKRDLRLPSPWENVTILVEKFDGRRVERGEDGAFRGLESGIYLMEK